MEVRENVANKMSIESISGRLMKIAYGRKTLVEWCAPERIGWRKVIIKTTFMILKTSGVMEGFWICSADFDNVLEHID